MPKAVLEMRGITKTFGSLAANKDVDLTVYEGEILALLGENGSGKTTLMNMLSGIYYPDAGEIFVDGKKEEIREPGDAHRLGIGMIHQHFKLVDVFTATENVALGTSDGSAFNLKAAAGKIKDIAGKYGFDLDPDQKVYDMSVSQKQTLEIIKQLYKGANILILDEPTAVLTPQETQKLFNVIRAMKKDGKSIIIITHKLQEVLEISDRVVILRKGENAGEVATSEADEMMLTEMMVGKKVELNINRPERKNRKERIRIEHLTCYNSEGLPSLKDVSFTAFGGEILGIAGISGCGQKELLEAIAGLQKCENGSDITFIDDDGTKKSLVGRNPRKIKELGITLAFVPEDRLGMGLVGSMGMTDNMLLRNYSEGSSFAFGTNKKNSKHLAEEIVEELDVKTPSISTPIRKLSGGNVQKVLVGREIAAAPKVLMTAYAVRGLDINTSYIIYDLLNQQKENGVAVIYVGEDLDVLLSLADRILVLCEGEVSDIVDARSVTKEEIGMLMTNNKTREEAGA